MIARRSGDLVIAEADSEGFKELSRVKALRGQCWTSPVLAKGQVCCKSGEGRIACVGVRLK